MTRAASNESLHGLLAGLAPELDPVVYRFAELAADTPPECIDTRACLAVVREAEGTTVIAPERALPAGASVQAFRAAHITLRVHSPLEAVGLTAAVADALTAEHISCNVIAGACHDHLLVPAESAEAALHCLERLAHTHRGDAA